MIVFIHWEADCAETGEGSTLELDYHDTSKRLLCVYNTVTDQSYTLEQYYSWVQGRAYSATFEQQFKQFIG